jgi:hypothetical protein
MPDPRDVSVSKLLAKMVCAMVDRPEFVVIKSHAAAHEYEPHVTIAYVRPEVAEKYIGNQITAGHRLVISEVVIRSKSMGETIVVLNG